MRIKRLALLDDAIDQAQQLAHGSDDNVFASAPFTLESLRQVPNDGIPVRMRVRRTSRDQDDRGSADKNVRAPGRAVCFSRLTRNF
jgi:hypothetical protein